MKEKVRVIQEEMRDFFSSLNARETEEVIRLLSKECNVALSTVNNWRLGYRIPRQRIEEQVRAFMHDFKKKS